MQIDWLTVSAQIVNFTVLVWLQQRVLYRPLARTLAAREEAVMQRLTDAESARTEYLAEAAAHREATRALEHDRDTHLQQVKAEAESMRAKLVGAAKEDIAMQRANWRSQLDDERAAFLDRLRSRAGTAFVAMARRVLTEMADCDLVEQMARVFARRLAGLAPEEQAKLRTVAADRGAAQVMSTFPLSSRAQAVVTEAVEKVVGNKVAVTFQDAPDIECGIMLTLGSRHLGWTMGEHLDALEEDVVRLLEAGKVAEAQT